MQCELSSCAHVCYSSACCLFVQPPPCMGWFSLCLTQPWLQILGYHQMPAWRINAGRFFVRHLCKGTHQWCFPRPKCARQVSAALAADGSRHSAHVVHVPNRFSDFCSSFRNVCAVTRARPLSHKMFPSFRALSFPKSRIPFSRPSSRYRFLPEPLACVFQRFLGLGPLQQTHTVTPLFSFHSGRSQDLARTCADSGLDTFATQLFWVSAKTPLNALDSKSEPNTWTRFGVTGTRSAQQVHRPNRQRVSYPTSPT